MTVYWADVECPDCGVPEGEICHWWCPRYEEPVYDEEDGDGTV